MNADVPLAQVLIRLGLFVLSFLVRSFFAASETAFLSMDRWAVEGLASTGERRARLLSSLASDTRSTVSAILIGTNVSTVLASVMGVSLASLLGAGQMVYLGLFPIVLTGSLFFFSELVPKTYAASMPTEIALAVAPVLAVLVTVLRPVSAVLSVVPHLFAGMVAQRREIPSLTDEPVRAAVDLAAQEGQVEREDGEVIVSVLDSSDTRVCDIMIPMDRVTTVRPDASVGEALACFKVHRFSRVPVVSPDSGEVLGIVYMKDVIREAMREPICVATPVASLMRTPFKVSPSENLLDVLARMRKNRVHFAVVSEEAKPLGIVTMEDILSEIVGDAHGDPRTAEAGADRSRKSQSLAAEADCGMSEMDSLEAVEGDRL